MTLRRIELKIRLYRFLVVISRIRLLLFITRNTIYLEKVNFFLGSHTHRKFIYLLVISSWNRKSYRKLQVIKHETKTSLLFK